LQESKALGLIFELWENLVLRFLKNTNFHDEEIWDAITEELGDLDFMDFTEIETFYLTLTSVLKKEERCFYEESLEESFLSYNQNYQDYYNRMYHVQRLCNFTYYFVNDMT
jgi:hypothetical protein